MILARHGRTAWNAEGRFQGHADPPLDPVGRGQAAALADALVARSPVAVWSSDLCRARDTAAPLALRCHLEVGLDAGWREVDLGGWEGLTAEEVAQHHPGEFAAWNAGYDVRRGGGETRAEAGQRGADALERVLTRSPTGMGTVVVVAHGLVLRATLDVLAAAGRIAVTGPAVHLANGAWVEIRW